MKYLKPTILASILTVIVSSTAFAGNIGGLRTAGNIGGTRAAGNIGGTRAAGNIGGTRSARNSSNAPAVSPEVLRFDLEGAISANFAGLIRMLLDSGALL
jgi:hypothetical protein